MATFADDFERANGAPGGNWTTNNANVAILNGYLQCSTIAFWNAINSTYSSGGRVSATARTVYNYNGASSGGPVVKATIGNTTGYCAAVTYANPTYTLRIYSGSTPGGTTLGSQALPYAPPGQFDLTLTWDNGVLTASIPGLVTATATDLTYATGGLGGVHSYYNVNPIASCSITAGSAPTFTVSPSPIGNYGAAVPLTFIGGNTGWTPGTPGSPTFTVDHGSLSGQVVASATSASANYDPGNFLGTATFTDPSTGLTCLVTVTSNPVTVPPSGAALTDTIVAYLQRSADAEVTSTIVNRNESLNTYGYNHTMSETTAQVGITLHDPTEPSGGSGTILGYLLQVYNILNGGSNWGGVATVLGNTSLIKADLDTVLTRLDLSQSGGSFTAGTLARALAGYPGGTIQDVLTALGGLSSPDLQPILDSLSAIRGDTTTSLATLLASLAGIRTTHVYSLQDVKDWVDGISVGSTDLTPVLNKLTSIQPSGTYTLTSIAGQASGLATSVGGIDTALDALTSSGDISLATLKVLLEAIKALAESIVAALSNPPVWTDLDHETVGDSIALSDGLDVSGPLDGVLISITAHPAGAGVFGFGDMRSWGHAGAVAFRSDRGDYEWPISLGPQNQVITPRSMRVAAGARIRLGSGYQGTVRPFSASGG